ncbi:MAG TPA: BTAD domain-containing putative transcriptional regulator [Propylenella sp.]|nr:BTAD domain-containing putative transcriptional regulator [Propylenella sp.]
MAQFLWEEVDREKATANLRTLLARMRAGSNRTGLQLVESDRENVWLATTTATDVQRVLSLAAIRGSAAARELCDVYQGDLLEDVESGGPELSDWLGGRRVELRNVFLSAVTAFLDGAVLPDDEQVAGHVARTLLRLDPSQEAAYRAMMRIHAAAGRLRDLENVFRNCCSRLSQDLDVQPDPKTVQLYRDLCGLSRDSDITVPMHTSPPAAVQSVPPGKEPASQQVRGLPTICVLMPPEAASSETHGLAAALLEDVTIGLCRQRTFTVVAPYTAWRLGPDGPEGDFVEQYGIDYVVQSRVQTYGGDTFLAAKLIDARSRQISWADRYLFNRADLANQYHNLTARIISSLSDAVESTELGRRDASAYYSYLLGTRALSEVQLPNVRRARTFFRASMRQDGSFGPAVSGVARTFHMEWLLLARGELDLLDEAELFSRRALSVDPDGAHGLRELGLCTLYRGRFDESLASFAEAERRNPQFADLLADYADALSMSGMPGDALRKIEQATGLNPLGPDRYWWYQGTIYYQLEQYEAAIRSVERMRDSTPAYKLLAACWAMLGERGQAREYVQRVVDVYPDFTVNKWLTMIPIRDTIVRRRYEEGLRLAGFG